MSEIRTDTINNASGDNDSGIDLSTNDQVDIKIAGSLKARVDSSGNLLVGTTNTLPAVNNVEGVAISSGSYGGFISCSRDGDLCSSFNRKTSNGTIMDFRKDGSTVGSIGCLGTLTIGSDAIGLRFNYAGLQGIVPWNVSTNAATDDVIDLGYSSVRFDDIYATNGTIQTSDQQEKNTITDSDLGIDFIKRLTPKSYIFNGKTRTHYGLIAQDVETVLTDINKPTSDFAGFIKDDISEEQDGSEYRYGLRYTEFVAPLIQAVKDQQATIDAQQATITALEARITALESE